MGLMVALLLSFLGHAESNGLVLGNRVRVTKIVIGTEPRRSPLVDAVTFGLTDRKDPDYAARRSLIGHTVSAFVEKIKTTSAPDDLPSAQVRLTLVDRDFNEIPSRGRGELGDNYFLGYEVRMQLIFSRAFRSGLRSPVVDLTFFGTRDLGGPEFKGAYFAHVGKDGVAGDASGAFARLFATDEWTQSPCAGRLATPVHSETAK